jgi:hypothetical protein
VEEAVQRLTALAFLLFGASHLSAPQAWIRYFQRMHAEGCAGAIMSGCFHAPLGLTILSFHWIWSGPALLVTLLGLLLLLRAGLHLVSPPIARASLRLSLTAQPWHFRTAGAGLMLVGGVVLVVTSDGWR